MSERTFVLHCESCGGEFLVFKLGGAIARSVCDMYALSKKKYGGYFRVKLNMPYKPRTTGENSQNHHLNGHIVQICNETGNDYNTVKNAVKMIAVEKMNYPYTDFHGVITPKRGA